MAKLKNNKNTLAYRINEEIYVKDSPMVRLVGENGNEVCHISKARELALNQGLDLIEINSNVTPPIVKIADYSKFLYEQKKNAKKKQQTSKPLKEIQLSVSIADNDMKVKASKAKDFLLDGSKVKVVLSMRGREKARRDENKRSLYTFITMLEDIAVPEAMPKDEGESKTIVILKKKANVN